MRRRLVIRLVRTVVVLFLVLFGLYWFSDAERRTLDATARKSMPGSFVLLGDGVTHYELSGPDTGRVVVLAHGVSVPYYIWDSTQVALAAAGYRVLRYDYYGRGGSDRPDIPYVPELYVRQLAQLLDALHIKEPINLAGLSYGGVTITAFAAAAPDRVRSLIYVDAFTLRPATLPWYVRALAMVPGGIEWYSAVVVAPEWAAGQRTDLLHPEKWPEWAAKYKPQMTFKGFRHARMRVMMDNSATDQTAALDSVGRHKRPVLVIWGRQDRTIPFEFSAFFMKSLPKATLLAVDSSGHLPHMEQSGIVQPAIIAFLKSVP